MGFFVFYYRRGNYNSYWCPLGWSMVAGHFDLCTAEPSRGNTILVFAQVSCEGRWNQWTWGGKWKKCSTIARKWQKWNQTDHVWNFSRQVIFYFLLTLVLRCELSVLLWLKMGPRYAMSTWFWCLYNSKDLCRNLEWLLAEEESWFHRSRIWTPSFSPPAFQVYVDIFFPWEG